MFFIMKLLCYVRHIWIKDFGPPLVQFGARQGRTKQFFPGPSDPFSFVGDKELERRCYLHFFDSYRGGHHSRNTPSVSGIDDSAQSAIGNRNAKNR